MAVRFLLDTNILSHLVREPQGRVANRIAEVGEDAVCTSIIVAAELRFGAAKSSSKHIKDRVHRILSAMNVMPLDPPADQHYGDIRQVLEKRGTPVGPNDLLIAAHARAMGLIVVTANVKEYARVPGLATENWLEGKD